MAHTPSASARVQRLSALVAISLVAIAVGFAFGRILLGHAATYQMLAVGLLSGVIAWATERRGMLVATLASAAALVLVLGWFAVRDTTWYGLPTWTSLQTLGTLATQVGAQAREYVSPAPATPALVMAGVIAVWASVFSCYALAFRAQSPLLALVPPAALVVFADSVLDELSRPMYGVFFLLAAVAVLFADGLRRLRGWGPIWSPFAGTRDRLLPAATRNARRVGLTAVAVAALAPVLVPGFGTKPVIDLSRFNSDGRIRVSPLVSMGSILSDTDNTKVEVFTVRTEHPSYWRMVALDELDGTTWQARTDEGVALNGDQVPGASASGQTFTQTFTVRNDLGFAWLVGAAEPTSISIEHDVTWHPASSSFQMDGWPDAGESYTVTSTRVNPKAKDLRGARLLDMPEDLELPTNIPPVIAEYAHEWTRDETTDFGKVMAIVRHLTGPEFDYSIDPGYRDDPQSLADFLTTTKKGFCQQFASLMAVMLRELKIPARIALGFTAGNANGPDTRVVTMANYHSWVEVPFEGYGWLSFDPTPGFADPGASNYQANAGGPSDVCPTQAHGCGQGPHKNDETDLQPPLHGKGATLLDNVALGGGVSQAFDRLQPTPAPSSPVPMRELLLAGGVVALVLAIGIPTIRAIRRRRRLHAARDPRTLILATYEVFADRAGELGWAKTPGETPEEYGRRLAEHAQAPGEERLGRLTSAVVAAAYAPAMPPSEAADAATEDAAAVLQTLRRTTGFQQRVLGLYRRR